MKTYVVQPYGYCLGVKRAIDLAIKTRNEHPKDNITILGMLIHNEIAIKKLEQYSIKSLYSDKYSLEVLLDEVKDGYLIFTAHGHSKKLEQKAINKGLQIIDASCPFVSLVRNTIENSKNTNSIVYIGNHKHPECQAIVEDYPFVKRIETLYDIELLPQKDNYIVTNQTTFSSYDLKEYHDAISKKNPNAIIKTDLCPTTKERQKGVMEIPNDVDLVYIVGDPHSNNTQKLCEIAGQHLPHVKIKKIATASEITNSDLDSSSFVAIASGASTPNEIVDEVIMKVKSH